MRSQVRTDVHAFWTKKSDTESQAESQLDDHREGLLMQSAIWEGVILTIPCMRIGRRQDESHSCQAAGEIRKSVKPDVFVLGGNDTVNSMIDWRVSLMSHAMWPRLEKLCSQARLHARRSDAGTFSRPVMTKCAGLSCLASAPYPAKNERVGSNAVHTSLYTPHDVYCIYSLVWGLRPSFRCPLRQCIKPWD